MCRSSWKLQAQLLLHSRVVSWDSTPATLEHLEKVPGAWPKTTGEGNSGKRRSAWPSSHITKLPQGGGILRLWLGWRGIYRTDVLTLVSPPIHEHGTSLYVFRSSLPSLSVVFSVWVLHTFSEMMFNALFSETDF